MNVGERGYDQSVLNKLTKKITKIFVKMEGTLLSLGILRHCDRTWLKYKQ
jgi:hypothetical protein